MIVSGESLIMMAIQIEEAGIQFYGELKKLFSKHSSEYKIVEFLQDEEKKHKKLYQTLRNKIKSEKRRLVDFTEEEIHNIRAFVESKVFDEVESARKYMIENRKDIPKILLYALAIELDTVYFFSKIEEKILPSEKEIIKDIIKEENSHVEKLIELREKIKFG